MASSWTSSVQKSYKYDVFLSFRGEDTRKNFVDHLYIALQRQGIHTYKDDEKLERGKKINDELLKSIEESKLYIIVFSKTYASSSWCLDELVKIMECQKAAEQIAYPVFYDVDPSEVRKQLGAVGEAFARHNNKGEAEKWREALKEAANLAGWDLRNIADGHEAKVINKIVECISLELRFINLKVDENIIGMESRIKSIVSSLETGVEDVRMIGIKGIGGGGKTTLARAVFDSICFSFEGKSFVENVREASKSSTSGLRSLQNQVLSDVSNDKSFTIGSVHEGKSLMRKMLCGKKVLLVLDDVDHLEQLEALAGAFDWFKPGSRIIITTRDEQVLVAHRVKWIHDVNLLSQDEAMCLFSRYAFRTDVPVQRYEELSFQVVRYAAGLPLTIKVLGSFLCGKTELEWEDALERLKRIPLHGTLERLELSYTSLEDDYKEIFLDVTCLLKGWNKETTISALESCGFRARNGLRVLEQKSLITITPYQQLAMHDCIEEMGRNIVRRSHPDNPSRHSRLWIREEIEDVLADDLVIEETRAIAISRSSAIDVGSKVLEKGFRNMRKLRFLHVEPKFENVFPFTEDRPNFRNPPNLPDALRFLNWRGYPHFCLQKTFQANNLVRLNMSYSTIKRLWEEGAERKVLKNLRFLDLSRSNLRTLDCGLFPNLEMLNLENCENLAELHVPIGSLRKLVSLYLHRCIRLITSLSFIKELESLQDLHLGFLHLTKFPLHSNYNLIQLYFSWNDIEEIPSSIGNLQKLVSLDLSYCKNLKRLPQSICSIRTLKDLNLKCCAIEELPEVIGHLESLETLNLMYSHVKQLPDSICMLKHLKTLLLEYCKVLEKLPEDLGLLESLEELSLSFCMIIRDVPSSICKLKHLKKLNLSCCEQLERLPENLGDLECLEELDLRGTSLRPPPLKGVKILRPFSKEQMQKILRSGL